MNYNKKMITSHERIPTSIPLHPFIQVMGERGSNPDSYTENKDGGLEIREL